MNELDVKNLFSSYFKSSDPVSKLMNTRSNGIGLNLCKRIMRGLQGDLEVISKYGKGSTFTLSLKTDVAVQPAHLDMLNENQLISKFKQRRSPITKVHLIRTNLKRDLQDIEEVEESKLVLEVSQNVGSHSEDLVVSALNVAGIIVADDSDINLAVFKNIFEDIFKLTNITYCINGQMTIDTCKAVLDQALQCLESGVRKLRPISLLILDFQMPFKNGIQVVYEVRQYFECKQ